MIVKLRHILWCWCLCGMLFPLAAQQPAPSPAPTPSIEQAATAPTPPATPATSPPGATTPPTELPTLPGPPPAAGPLRRFRVLSHRQIFSPATGTYQFIGDVSLETAEIVIHAAEATYDSNSEKAIARGNVSIRAEDGNTYWGNVLELDVRTRQWRFLDWSAELPPGYLGRPFIGPVIIEGQELSGLPNYLRAERTRVTTCDLPNPHYLLVAREVEVFPGDKLIARDTDLYVLGHRVLRLPWFILWLKQKRSPVVPEFGRNEQEGYYLRALYQYVLSPDQLGGIRLDTTQKLGEGLGIDHFYTVPNGYGEAFVYGRQNLTEYVTRLDHTQQLPAGVNVRFTGDVRKNSLFTFQPTTLTNVTTNIARPTPHTNTFLNFTRRLNQGSFSTDNTNANLVHTSNTTGGTFRLSEEYSSFGRGGAGANPADQELWSRVQWMRKVGFGNLNLRLDRRDDLDHGASGVTATSGVQRLPEVYLETDNRQLNLDFLSRVPSQLTAGWGVFDEQPNNVRLSRYLFNWRARPTAIKLGNTELSPNASYRQTFYGDADATALYLVNAGITARTTFGPLSNVVSYGRQQRNGFSPFRFDTAYPYETLNDSIQFITKPVRIFLTGGRDLQNRQWQDMTFRSETQLLPALSMTQSFAYDLNNGNWRDLVSQYRWVTDPTISLGLGSRYDLEHSKLRQASTDLAWVINPRWRLQWLGGYNGTTRQVTYNELLLTRDLHCWDASAYYSYQNRTVFLYFRLKALNLALPQFGIGRGGQVLSTSQGIQF